MANDPAQSCQKTLYLALGKMEGFAHIMGVLQMWRGYRLFTLEQLRVLDALAAVLLEEQGQLNEAIRLERCRNRLTDKDQKQREAHQMQTKEKTQAERLNDLVRGAQAFIAVIDGLALKNTAARLEASGLVRQATNQLAVAIINEGLSAPA